MQVKRQWGAASRGKKGWKQDWTFLSVDRRVSGCDAAGAGTAPRGEPLSLVKLDTRCPVARLRPSELFTHHQHLTTKAT